MPIAERLSQPEISPATRVAMLYAQAEDSARSGDWELSSRLMERCCKMLRFRDPRLNSQWMVSADRADPAGDLGARALELARCAWLIGEGGGALEFLQLALWRQPHAASQAREALELSKKWPAQLVSPMKATAFRRRSCAGAVPLRVGHLLGCINPTHAPSKLVQALISEMPPEAVRSFVYTSEWAARWFHNWDCERQSGPQEFLAGFRGAERHITETQGCFLERARRLARCISADRIDVLVVHASNVELVTALAACLHPASRLVNVNHASEMCLPCFDGYVHMFANGLKRTAAAGLPARVIPPASDMGDRLRTAPRIERGMLGIPSTATLSGTFGNLYKIENATFLSSLRRILEAHPQHYHLVAGGGDTGKIRTFFSDCGLENRVLVLGRRSDIPSLLGLLDFYLASHPYPGALSEIEAMAAGCPVISMRDMPTSHFNSGAEVVGLEECLVDMGDFEAAAALAARWLTDRSYARELGEKLRSRYEAEFRPAMVAARHLEFYRSLLGDLPEAVAAEPDTECRRRWLTFSNRGPDGGPVRQPWAGLALKPGS